MKAFVTLVAVLAAAPAHPQAPKGQTFACEGRGTSNGYPFGVQDTGRAFYRIVDNDREITVFRVEATQQNICGNDDPCPVVTTGDIVKLDASGKPGWDAVYSSDFRFNRKTLAFEASGGGLDGGWLVVGTCKAESYTRP
jgi:hypothetical protein